MGSYFSKKKTKNEGQNIIENEEDITKEEENSKDILKIELYPKKKPRYEFNRHPLKKLIEKNTLGFSFNENDSLAFINSKVPVLNGFYLAHSNHYPIRIKPDHIWLLIVQAFSNHVNANAEELRNLFVNFSGQKTLAVNYPLSDISQVGKKDLESFSEQINEQIKEYIGDELIDTLTPNFTTTDHDSTIICKISIMGAFKKYFKYEMHLCGCGVPYVILEGTDEDFEKILKKAEKLRKYQFDWYIDRIIPHIKKMVEAKKGNIDVNYFKNMVQDDETTEYVSGLSGRGGHNIKVPLLKGWILSFFAYYSEVKGEFSFDQKVPPFEEDSIKVKDFEKLANQMLTVPFQIIDSKKKTYDMKYSVGFIECDQNKRNEVFPVTGWLVEPRTEKDEESIL